METGPEGRSGCDCGPLPFKNAFNKRLMSADIPQLSKKPNTTGSIKIY